MSSSIKQLEQHLRDEHQPAKGLPFSCYQAPDVFELEQRTIFYKDWIFACPADRLQNCGDYFAFSLNREMLVIIRGKDHRLRVMSNNCKHRGTPLLDEGFGKVNKLISCPYHAWSYDDKGDFLGAPFAAKDEIAVAAHQLPQYKVEVFLNLVFVNLDQQAQPIQQRFSEIMPFLHHYNLAQFDQSYLGETEQWQANWKLIYENAIESYHLFKVHKETLNTITPTKLAYYVAGNSEWSLTGGKLTLDMLSKLMLKGSPSQWQHYLLISLPPSIVIILNYDSLSWINLSAQSAESTEIQSGYLSKKSWGSESKSSQKFTESFFAEDKFICERLQRGMAGTLATPGQLVTMEKVLVDFQHYLGSRLFQLPHYDTELNNEDENVFYPTSDTAER